MKTLPSHLLWLGALATFGPHGGVLAHGDDAGRSVEGSRWGLGVAVMSEIKPYRNFDDKTEFVPFFTYENRWVRVFGPGVEFKLGTKGPVAFGLTATYGMDGYKADDSPFLEGMARRRGSAWVGARATLRGEPGQLSAEWAGDASGHSKGQRLKLGLERRFTFGDVGVTPRLAASWLDRKFVQYYYGVEAAEVRPGRVLYSPGSTVNTEVGLRLDYSLAPKQTVFADVGTTALGGGIRKSPLVGRSSVPEARLGYLYRF